jgi:hypothetical protein
MSFKWLRRDICAPGPYTALCLSEEDYRKALLKLGIKYYDSPWVETDARTHTFQKNGDIACIVCLNPETCASPIETAALLVHESVHIWRQYCESIGEHSPAKEQEAYGIQAISQNLMEEYVRQVF